MGSSVPGNSCRTTARCTAPSTGAGCLVTLAGTCVYYSGTHLTGPGISTGDKLNTVITKLVDYIDDVTGGSTLFPVVSADFEPDGITCNLPQLAGLTFEIFLNEVNRFIYNETGNQEWDYLPTGGFTILMPGFDASTVDFHLYVFTR